MKNTMETLLAYHGDSKVKEKYLGRVHAHRLAGTRRAETLALVDLYRIAVRSRVNAGVLVRAREKKAKKADRLARARIARADKRMSELCGPRWSTL